jgi:hypothetical protein
VLLGPHEIAQRIQYQCAGWWVVWYGQHTRLYWAVPVPSWVPGSRAEMLWAATPEALEAAIKTFEMFNPRPSNHTLPFGKDEQL